MQSEVSSHVHDVGRRTIGDQNLCKGGLADDEFLRQRLDICAVIDPIDTEGNATVENLAQQQEGHRPREAIKTAFQKRLYRS